MEKIIYKMEDNIKKDFCEHEIKCIDETFEMIDGLTQEEYNDLCIDLIVDDLRQERNKCIERIAKNKNVVKDLMNFYYKDRLISYEIQYNKGLVTGDIIVCLE